MNFVDAIGHPGLMPRPERAAGQRTDSCSAWAWALRALRRELLGFRFDFPLEIVPEACPRSGA